MVLDKSHSGQEEKTLAQIIGVGGGNVVSATGSPQSAAVMELGSSDHGLRKRKPSLVPFPQREKSSNSFGIKHGHTGPGSGGSTDHSESVSDSSKFDGDVLTSLQVARDRMNHLRMGEESVIYGATNDDVLSNMKAARDRYSNSFITEMYGPHSPSGVAMKDRLGKDSGQSALRIEDDIDLQIVTDVNRATSPSQRTDSPPPPLQRALSSSKLNKQGLRGPAFENPQPLAFMYLTRQGSSKTMLLQNIARESSQSNLGVAGGGGGAGGLPLTELGNDQQYRPLANEKTAIERTTSAPPEPDDYPGHKDELVSRICTSAQSPAPDPEGRGGGEKERTGKNRQDRKAFSSRNIENMRAR